MQSINCEQSKWIYEAYATAAWASLIRLFNFLRILHIVEAINNPYDQTAAIYQNNSLFLHIRHERQFARSSGAPVNKLNLKMPKNRAPNKLVHERRACVCVKWQWFQWHICYYDSLALFVLFFLLARNCSKVRRQAICNLICRDLRLWDWQLKANELRETTEWPAFEALFRRFYFSICEVNGRTFITIHDDGDTAFSSWFNG